MPKMRLWTGAVPILPPRDRTKKTEKEGKQWEKRRKVNETKFDFYRYGVAHLTGLSDRVCAQQTTPVFKIKSKDPGAESTSYSSSRTAQITDWKL
jgi:hypothetical protein